MKQNINKLVIASMLAFTSIISCDKKLDVLDENNPRIENYFRNTGELQNGVNAIYSTLRSGHLVGREWFFLHDMRGGETDAGGAQLEAPRAELLKQSSPSPSNSVLTDVWRGAYTMINRANLVLSEAATVTDNAALRDRLVGETKFLRAWAYFELVSQWGDVPVYTTPISSYTDFKAKSTAANVYTLVISDLTEAAQKLPDVAPQAGRATKGAANALLGRVQMQKGDYSAARTALLKVYGKYSLEANYSDNFSGDVMGSKGKLTDGKEFNAESIFEVAFVDKGDNNFNWGYNGEGASAPVSTVRNQEYGIVWGNVIPSDRLLNEFEPNDPRYEFSIWEEGDVILSKTAGPTKTLAAACPDPPGACASMNVAVSNRNNIPLKRVFRKYSIYDWDDNGFHPGGINQRLIRYADVLLMLAECEAEVGTPAKAAEYINEVRSRPSVAMPTVTLTTKNQALRAVMRERAVELAAEAVANIDILRWRKQQYFPLIMADPKPGQTDLLPIPAAETSTNPLLK